MELFTAAELATFTRQAINDDAYRLAHDLTLDAILAEVGPHLADPPQPGVKSVALPLAARGLTNPGGVAAESAGSVSITYAQALSGIVMSKAEQRRLRRVCGMGARATSVDIGPVEPVFVCADGWVSRP
jgi:hypothetical protein